MAAETLMASETAAETSYPAEGQQQSQYEPGEARQKRRIFINTFRIEIDFIDKRVFSMM